MGIIKENVRTAESPMVCQPRGVGPMRSELVIYGFPSNAS